MDYQGYQDPAAITGNAMNQPIAIGDPSAPGWLQQLHNMLQARGIDISQLGLAGPIMSPGGGGGGAPPQQGQQPSSGNPWTDAANRLQDIGAMFKAKREAAVARRAAAPTTPGSINITQNPQFGQGAFGGGVDFGGGGNSPFSNLLNGLKF